jgi:hypothetical protein
VWSGTPGDWLLFASSRKDACPRNPGRGETLQRCCQWKPVLRDARASPRGKRGQAPFRKGRFFCPPVCRHSRKSGNPENRPGKPCSRWRWRQPPRHQDTKGLHQTPEPGPARFVGPFGMLLGVLVSWWFKPFSSATAFVDSRFRGNDDEKPSMRKLLNLVPFGTGTFSRGKRRKGASPRFPRTAGLWLPHLSPLLTMCFSGFLIRWGVLMVYRQSQERSGR